jgi:hypothetical protein
MCEQTSVWFGSVLAQVYRAVEGGKKDSILCFNYDWKSIAAEDVLSKEFEEAYFPTRGDAGRLPFYSRVRELQSKENEEGDPPAESQGLYSSALSSSSSSSSS